MKQKIKITKTVGPFKRGMKWVKKHKKTIYISAATLAALITAYELYKLRKQKLSVEKLREEIRRIKRESRMLSENLDMKIYITKSPDFRMWFNKQSEREYFAQQAAKKAAEESGGVK